MTPSREPHAFISYVREDAESVDELEQVLVSSGIPVWRDVRSLFPGDRWKSRIRQAIQEDALAFIPVFSAASEARFKSHMREELRLAIDEYRKMDPDQPWIFSVRLGEVDLPNHEISSDQVLSDLNWTDFFGSRKTLQTVNLVERIRAILGERPQSVASPAAVAASASDANRGPLLAAMVREGVSDAAKAADAAQAVVEEARRVTSGLNDEARFSLDRPEGSLTQASLTRFHELRRLTEPLIDVAVELGARGSQNDTQLATQVVGSLAREGFAVRGGVERMIQLRKLPAVLVLVAGGLSAVARQNAAMFAAFTSTPRVDVNGHSFLVPSILSPWDPFGPEWELPQFLIATLEGAEPTDEVFAAYDRGQARQRRSNPASEVVQHVLESAGRQFAIGRAEFDDLFHRTEILIGTVTMDWILTNAPQAWGARNWIGGHTRADRYAQTTLPRRMLAELEQDGVNWWPLAGGSFGSSFERARAALTAYADAADEVSASRREYY